MKSLSQLFTAAAVLAAATRASSILPRHDPIMERQYKTLVYQGCYSASDGLSKNSSYTYNTQGYCQTQCVPANYAVEGVSQGQDCWCGNEVPPSDSKVDDSKCDTPCAGFGTDMCGGSDYWSVYLTGLSTSAPNSGSSSSSASSSASGTTSATPSVVTIGGQTMTVTSSASASSSAKAGSSGGASKAGIAAGVVVGVIAIAAIAGGGYLFWRNKKRREVEKEHQQAAAVSSFIAGGKASPSTNGESFDSHLEPSVMASRRMSNGSLADDQDYSRRILKVTNA